MKERLLALTRAHLTSLSDVQKRVGRYSGSQIQAGSLLANVQGVAATWFDSVKPALESAGFSLALVNEASRYFERLLRASRTKPGKNSLLATLNDSRTLYLDHIVHQIEIGSFSTTTGLSITPFIEGLPSDEGEYLAEAQRCLTANALRACIVLGWCATIARIHAKIGEIGYDNFSRATEEMAAKTTGRFKPFNKKQMVASLSELQKVFDTDLLWVLEYLQLIDNNQHQRLRYCFEFRNNSAHPGLAPIKGPNLYSFYSDISEIVLKNKKFALNDLGVHVRKAELQG
ncbi:MAG TPA: hypothetical protein VGC77_20405 [Rhodopseudomonas sp.]|uniref:hypothetical protein n=1 Tax=Rhodopseudomonas sp. TaxID=1078 RepID=UPI002ED87AE8